MCCARWTGLMMAMCGTALLLAGCTPYSVKVQTQGQGTVQLDPEGDNYAANTPVNVSAFPATGWHMDHWAGDLNGNTNPATLIVDADKTVTAVFAINTYTLTYSAGIGGTISGGSVQTVNHGDSGAAVTAQPNPGYRFVQWSDNVLFSLRTDTNVIGNVTVSAVFAQNIYRVDASNGGGGDGLSWTAAFNNIQSAVDAASAAGGGEVWVAGGIYTKAATVIAAVVMAENVHLYGGFGGYETARSQRNVAANATFIDGEGKGRCVEGAGNATLDGFVVTNGSGMDEGGGMHNEGVEALAVANCTFTGNKAYTFMNFAYGAGMFNYNSSLTVRNCVFTANAIDGGGGSTGRGGGMCNNLSSPSVSNCIFINNLAYGNNTGSWISRGGGMYNLNGSSPTLTNCTFALNSAAGDAGLGGAVFNEGGIASLKNCILWGNLAGAYPEMYSNVNAAPTVTFSCVEGGHPGTGNINANPLFVDAANGYVQLKNGSPCIDTGDSSGIRGTDIAGVSRPQGAGVDMGAYER